MYEISIFNDCVKMFQNSNDTQKKTIKLEKTLETNEIVQKNSKQLRNLDCILMLFIAE